MCAAKPGFRACVSAGSMFSRWVHPVKPRISPPPQSTITRIAREALALAAQIEGPARWHAIIGLIAAGNDIAALANAMAITARRSEELPADERFPHGL